MHWVLLDTETNGLRAPIFVLELAAQRMSDWTPVGPPFRKLLNHNREIPSEASRINGYTREILERDGEPPDNVHRDFAHYAQGAPLVAYNLDYDYDQVLVPEWQRLGVQCAGERGFCMLRLAQRLLDPVPAGNHKLQTLRQYYHLPERGAHTALGDVLTVIDLLQHVLRPLAQARGLCSFEDLSRFASQAWFPTRIAFGRFKGRDFREAAHDEALRSWLQWLTKSVNRRTAEMGHWYLEQLRHRPVDSDFGTSVTEQAGTNIVVHRDPQRSVLERLIEQARLRLADLQAQYTRDLHASHAVMASLFERMRPLFEQRDQLRLLVEYRRRYLERLTNDGEHVAARTAEQYEHAQAHTRREYEQAAEASASQTRILTQEEEAELRTLWRKLVRLFHPDRHDPRKRALYDQLTAIINRARDECDIQRLREIAEDPNGFLARMGLGEMGDAAERTLDGLRDIHDALQGQIMELMDKLEELYDGDGWKLYQLSTQDDNWLDATTPSHQVELKKQIEQLQRQADQLAQEIAEITGQPVIF